MNRTLTTTTRTSFNRLISTAFAWKSQYPTLNHDITTSYLPKILRSRVYEAAVETRTQHAVNLSGLLKNEVYLKREDSQPVFSFKIRGAYNKVAELAKQAPNGIVTCSAGNHAQGVAFSANKLKMKATIVMPSATPRIKVDNVSRLGGSYVNVVLHGADFGEASAEANRYVKEEGLTLVHPFNDESVIAGQGTIGMEILKALHSESIDSIFLPVGGGGMIAGVAAYIKAIRPEIKIIGVEAEDAPGMTESLQQGKVVELGTVGLFADGAAVRKVGDETFRICNNLVDGMITVKTDEICAAIKHCFNDTRSILEPAGALGIAGIIKYCQTEGVKGKTLIAVTSGANMDFDRLRFVSERADSSETLMSLSIPERHGAIREFYKLIYPRNLTEFSYRWSDPHNADVVFSFQSAAGVNTELDKQIVMENLTKNGYNPMDLSNNELAKAHIRHLAGGRPGRDLYKAMMKNNQTGNLIEIVYRIEFPSVPGALSRFFFALTDYTTTDKKWNISLLHYRNHGHDLGRVLVGMLIDEAEVKDLTHYMREITKHNPTYRIEEETENPAFAHFLK